VLLTKLVQPFLKSAASDHFGMVFNMRSDTIHVHRCHHCRHELGEPRGIHDHAIREADNLSFDFKNRCDCTRERGITGDFLNAGLEVGRSQHVF
jgi:hypothetical protein